MPRSNHRTGRTKRNKIYSTFSSTGERQRPEGGEGERRGNGEEEVDGKEEEEENLLFHTEKKPVWNCVQTNVRALFLTSLRFAMYYYFYGFIGSAYPLIYCRSFWSFSYVAV